MDDEYIWAHKGREFVLSTFIGVIKASITLTPVQNGEEWKVTGRIANEVVSTRNISNGDLLEAFEEGEQMLVWMEKVIGATLKENRQNG